MPIAKKAIIMAAGVGERLRPVTLKTPKPMIKVNGVCMIETVIQALYERGIWNIYIVVGYLKEQFAVLEQKYEGVHLIENPDYETSNNISSLYAAREHLGECVILDGDQMIYEPDILKKQFSQSCYCCKWTEEETGEWLLKTENGRVSACSRNGGSHGWQLYSVSFWTREDGMRLRTHLEKEFIQKKNRQLYWDDVALFCYPEQYNLGIREIRDGDIVEIDNIRELCELDASYLVFSGKDGG